MQPLQMLNAIWHKTMTTFFERSRRKQKGSDLADIPSAKYLTRQQTSQRYKVYPSDDNTFQVENALTGVRHTVLLEERTCGCTRFDEYNSPCSHGIAAIRFVKKNPFDYFDNCYFLQTYRKTYSMAIPPISIQGLKSDERTLPPIVHKKRGRPPTKRIRKSQLWRNKKAPRSCGICGERGHDRRKCYGQPLASGKQQRARDRAVAAADISSGSEAIDAMATLDETDSDLSDSLTSDEAEEFQYLIDNARKREAEKVENAAAEAAHEAELVAIFGPDCLVPFSPCRIGVAPPKYDAIGQEARCVAEQQQNMAQLSQDPEEETNDDDAGSTIVVSPLKPIRKRNRAIISTVGSSGPPPSFKMSLRSRN
jgi:hypothetical protein